MEVSGTPGFPGTKFRNLAPQIRFSLINRPGGKAHNLNRKPAAGGGGPRKFKKMRKLGALILALSFICLPEMARGGEFIYPRPAGQQVTANESGRKGKVAAASQSSSTAKKLKAAARKRKKK